MLLAVPALRDLRRAGPVTLAAAPRLAALLHALDVVDEGLALDGLGLAALFAGAGPPAGAARLRAAARVACWMGAGDAAFAARLRALAPAAVVASSTGADGAVWEHLRATIGAAGPAPCQPVAVPPALEDAARAALGAAGWDGAARLLVVHPGAGGAAKCWPAAGFARLVERARSRGFAVAVHVGPAPADRAAAVALRDAGAPGVLWLEDPPLPVLAGALRAAAAYAGNDSGVSHLAAAVGTPALVLFTPALARWRPWSASTRVLDVDTARLVAADVAAALDALTTLPG